MASENNIDKGEQPEAVAGGNARSGRRRFVRGVAAAVPVVLTMGSRSALATSGCLSPSASASISLLHSRPDRPRDGVCLGRTPGYWGNASKTHPTEWAQVGAEGMLFSSVYAGGFPGKTLKQVIQLNGSGDPYQLGAHLAAAWCNWKMGWVPASILDLADLQAMWAGRNTGYTPVSGVTWYAEDIVTYLKTTMPL